MSDNWIVKFVWDEAKNRLLKGTRNVSFEQVVEAVAQNKIVDIRYNPNQKYAGQKVYIVELNQYPHFVPFQDLDESNRLLITIVPSRKLKKKRKEQ